MEIWDFVVFYFFVLVILKDKFKVTFSKMSTNESMYLEEHYKNKKTTHKLHLVNKQIISVYSNDYCKQSLQLTNSHVC